MNRAISVPWRIHGRNIVTEEQPCRFIMFGSGDSEAPEVAEYIVAMHNLALEEHVKEPDRP